MRRCPRPEQGVKGRMSAQVYVATSTRSSSELENGGDSTYSGKVPVFWTVEYRTSPFEVRGNPGGIFCKKKNDKFFF